MFALLGVAGIASAVIGETHNPGAPSGWAEVSPATVSDRPLADGGRGAPYAMPVATISSGSAVFSNGSFAIIGQPIVGTMSNAQYTAHVGAVAVLAIASTGAAVPGDCDGDGEVDLDDFAELHSCVAGPGGGLGPGCECFDNDGNGDVDLADFAWFQVAFTGQ